MREHFNDVPGDIAGSEAENLPGGLGEYDPDNDVDATIDEQVGNDVMNPDGRTFGIKNQQGGSTTGTGYTEPTNDGASVPPEDLLEGEEGHPGAAVGFTGAERDKRATQQPRRARQPEEPALGGRTTEPETDQQERNMSVETEGPTGSQGSGGAIGPDEKAA
ncbi:MAG: hypothetical protein ACYDCO_12170 [Armatimonadota bacterium]